ncbi:MFS transporter [Aurantiacibacter odishensis]|uniref:MFS transporter n=1 Tax=Aurantiacibacter odishensis TaxID=1155476 RepID=UPI000E75415E|nr:MFS transporter [Aurantiacibacter odishensis]
MATTAPAGFSLVLTENKLLRLLTLLLFYFTQGFPVGLFFYAVPTWMAANGSGTAEIASVVGISALPWSLKIINGFLIDRYTFLPMGRRRVWIIGAQGCIVLALLAGAVAYPEASDVILLSVLGFAANAAVTFQDVGIDSLAVDIMPEEERAHAGGVMGGAQLIGIAATTAAGGWLLANYGIAVCLMIGAIIPGLVMLYGIVIKERPGERHLPWTDGKSHPRNLDIQVEAWWPLLKNSFRAIVMPLSLLFVPLILARAVPWGGFEAFHPVLFQETGGWKLTEYTSFISTLGFVSGVTGLVVGGWLTEKIGAQRTLIFCLVIGIVAMAAMGFAQPYWSNPRVLVAFMVTMDMMQIFYFIAGITMAMRLCSPAVAATQFTIYMASGNFGRPMGAWLAAETAGAGNPQLFYWSLAAFWAVVLAIALKVTFPGENRAQHEVAEGLPQGEGPSPRVN